MASVTLSMDEYTALMDRVLASENDAVTAKKKALEAALTDPNGTIKLLVASHRDALTIIRFAVSNLPPEVIRGWPALALGAFAHRLPELPDATTDDQSLALELTKFASEIDMHERRRAYEAALIRSAADTSATESASS